MFPIPTTPDPGAEEGVAPVGVTKFRIRSNSRCWLTVYWFSLGSPASHSRLSPRPEPEDTHGFAWRSASRTGHGYYMQDELGPVGGIPSCATQGLQRRLQQMSVPNKPRLAPFQPRLPSARASASPVPWVRSVVHPRLHGPTLGQLHSDAGPPCRPGPWPATVPEPRGDEGVLCHGRMEGAGRRLEETPVACLARPVNNGTARPRGPCARLGLSPRKHSAGSGTVPRPQQAWPDTPSPSSPPPFLPTRRLDMAVHFTLYSSPSRPWPPVSPPWF